MKAATVLYRPLVGADVISIHAAREGGDLDATALRALVAISIHAAREGGDANGMSGLRQNLHFNPRRP